MFSRNIPAPFADNRYKMLTVVKQTYLTSYRSSTSRSKKITHRVKNQDVVDAIFEEICAVETSSTSQAVTAIAKISKHDEPLEYHVGKYEFAAKSRGENIDILV